MSVAEARGATGCIEINTERCEGCGLCVPACPKGCIELGTTVNGMGHATAVFARPEQCSGCANCAESCPNVCITVWR